MRSLIIWAVFVALLMLAAILLLGRVTPPVNGAEHHAGVRVKCDPKTGRCKPYPMVLAGSCTATKGWGDCRRPKPRPCRPTRNGQCLA